MRKKITAKVLILIFIISIFSTPLIHSQKFRSENKLKINNDPETCQLNIEVYGEGTYTIDPPGGVYDKGTKITVTAIPAEDYRFTQWGSDSFDDTVEFDSTGWFFSYELTDSFTIKEDTNLYVGFIKILIEYVDFFIRAQKSNGNWGSWEDERITVDVGTTLEFKMEYKFTTNVIIGFSGMTLIPYDCVNFTYPPGVDPMESYFEYIEGSYSPKKIGHPRIFLIMEPGYMGECQGMYWVWMSIKKFEVLTQTFQAKVIKPFAGDIEGAVSAFDLSLSEMYFSEDLLWDYVRVICEEAEEPVLSFNPKNHDFEGMLEGETDSTSFEIWNSGNGNLEYSLSEDCPWLDLSKDNGNSNGEHDEIIIDIDTTNLEPDEYFYPIEIDSNGGEDEFSVNVIIYEEGKPAMSIQPNPLDFGKKEKGNEYIQNFNIKNVGEEVLDFQLTENSDWIKKIIPKVGNLNAGESESISVKINTSNLSFGFHSNEINIHSESVEDKKLNVNIDIFEEQEGKVKLITGRKYSNGVKSVIATACNMQLSSITNVTFDLYLNYGFFSKNKNERKTIEKIEPGDKESIQINNLRGFGPVYLEARLNADEIDEIIVKKRGFMIFGFIFLL